MVLPLGSITNRTFLSSVLPSGGRPGEQAFGKTSPHQAGMAPSRLREALSALPVAGRSPLVTRWRNSSQCMKDGERAQKGPTKSDKCLGPREPALEGPGMTHAPNLKSSFCSVIDECSGADAKGLAPSARTPWLRN